MIFLGHFSKKLEDSSSAEIATINEVKECPGSTSFITHTRQCVTANTPDTDDFPQKFPQVLILVLHYYNVCRVGSLYLWAQKYYIPGPD